MQDRRRSARFSLGRPLEGTLKLLEEVLVERYVENEMTVLATMPAKPTELMVIDRVIASNGALLDARVAESQPAIMDGLLKHRLTLRIDEDPRAARPIMIGGLVRTIPVHLLEMSEGGCQMVSPIPVASGLVGELCIALDDCMRSEALQICRCQMLSGAGSLFRVGAQFRLMPLSSHSFRSRLLERAAGALTAHERT